MRTIFVCLVLTAATVALPAPARADRVRDVLAPLDKIYRDLDALYQDLHRHPELSNQERQSAAKLASRLRALGFKVTTGVGKTGVVGILENGAGPTIMVRTELDALPVEEKTGLPYASKDTAIDPTGARVPVMHACGHDVHMAAWVGTATLLSRSRSHWRGTLMMVAQPAEEMLTGARAMIADGLFTRWKKPDHAVAVHVYGLVPAGVIGYVPGFHKSSMDSVDIKVLGRGGHGAAPHRTIDPVLLAARIVVTLQSIVSREIDPRDPAVVTVGSIHGGTKHNVIPDEVKLQITMRSYSETVRNHLREAVGRIARGEAAAANAPAPEVVITAGGDAAYNDPALTTRIAAALVPIFGPEGVRQMQPLMTSEDFGEYPRAGVPSVQLMLGSADAAVLARAEAAGQEVPANHNSAYAPLREPTIKGATTALTAMALELLGKP